MFLSNLFLELNNRHIRYLVLRNYQSLPNDLGGSDLDVLVHNEDYQLTINIIKVLLTKHYGYIASYIKHYSCPRICIVGQDFGIQIDLHINAFLYRGVIIYDWIFLSGFINEYNSIKVLDDRVSDIIAFLKEVLNNKYCKEKYFIAAQKAYFELSEDDKKVLLEKFTKRTQQKIIDVLSNNMFDNTSIRSIGKIASSELLTISGKIKYYLLQTLKLNRIFRKTGYVIVFLGTDGSGKSTIIEKITPVLNETFHNGVHYEHLRPNYIPPLAVLLGKKKKSEVNTIVENPHEGKSSGFWGSLFRLNYYLVDYICGYYLKIFPQKCAKSCIWIFDRYYYDYLIDQKRNCIKLPLWLIKFYGLFVPKPDLIVCLGTNADIIRNRKPELPLVEIERQINALEKFSKNNTKTVWVDTGCSEEVSVTLVMDAICKMTSKRKLHL